MPLVVSNSSAVTKKRGHERPLKRTLILWFLLLALVPMGLLGLFSFRLGNASLAEAAEARLEAVARSTVVLVQMWFDDRVLGLESLAETRSNSEFLAQLRTGIEQSALDAPAYVKSDDWVTRVGNAESELVEIVRRYDYLHDLLLIDTDGNVLYNVSRESDLGANLVTGPLYDTGFARAVRASLEGGQVEFADLERFATSANAIAAFLVAPLLDDFGDRIGVIAMQLNPSQFLQKISDLNVGNDSSSHYLVGKDGRLRSALDGDESEVLKRSITTEQFRSWQAPDPALEESALDAGHGSTEYIGPNGRQVIGLRQNVRLPGTEWVLISEIDRDEAFAAADWLGSVVLLAALLSAAIAAALAWILSGRITRPLIQLADASRAIAACDIERRVRVSADNEIGALADALNHMMDARQEHEKALQKSNLLAQDVMADLSMQKFAMDQHAIIAITEVDGTITFVNDNFVKISGYRSDELIGQNHRLLNSGQRDKDFWRDMYRTITDGNVWHGEICNKAKDGQHYWVESTIVPFMGADGKPTSYIAIRTDITALKLAEVAAEVGSQAKSEFLANMSHEIRTPMNGVIGMTNLLLDGELDQEQYGHAMTIKRSAESLLDIINDILDFSKIEAGKLDLEIVDFDLGTLLEDLASTMVFRAEGKGLELICPAEPVIDQWYRGDPGRVRQILMNLIDNGIKFTDAGEVVVRQEVVDHSQKRSTLRFTITDNGIGLNSEQRQKLFQKFTQADSSTTRQYGGTGLGLSICKQLVEMMGGAIGVTSKPGEGSTFWFTIDLRNAVASSPARPTDDLLGERILVVDDNDVSCRLIGQILSAWHIKHARVGSGSAALQALREAASDGKPYNIAIIDKRIADMDGAGLATLIRDEPKFAETRTILLTSQEKRSNSTELRDSGFAACLSKPVHQSELYNALLQAADIDDRGNKRPIVRHPAREPLQFQARVLLVEDNLTNQAVAKGMLRKFGLGIDLATNGLEAIHALEAHHYDLVFMDCQMPEMDGYAATRHIRDPQSSVRDHEIPVIAMTAHAMQGDREKCLDAGMNDYLTKPVEPRKLRRALQQWLPAESNSGTARLKALRNNGALTTTCSAAASGKTAAAPAERVFDDAAMSDRLMGDEALMRTVAETFLNDMMTQIASLKSAATAGDVQKSTAQAHKIKGAAANVGGIALSACALDMEAAGMAGEIQAICRELPQLEQSFTQLKAAMEEVLF